MESHPSPPADPRHASSVRQPPRDELTLAAALAADVALFRGASDAPTIRLPNAGGVWPLRSPRVRAWLAKLCWSACGQLPRPREIDVVLLVLEHEAWSGPRQLPLLDGEGRAGVGGNAERRSTAIENGDGQTVDDRDVVVAGLWTEPRDDSNEPDRLWAFVEGDPVTAAVVELAMLAPTWEGRMCDLLERLTNLALLRKLIEPSQTRRGSPRRAADERTAPWPRIAGALGAHLRRQSGLIERAGVRIEIARTNRGSMVRLTNVAERPSGAPDPGGPGPSADAPPTGHETTANSPLGDDRSAASPSLTQDSSSPRNLLDANDLPLDYDDRPQPAAWPSPPLKCRKSKDLPQNRDDRADRIGKKRKTPATARRPAAAHRPSPQPPPAGRGKKSPRRRARGP